jgi:hypothetical protein
MATPTTDHLQQTSDSGLHHALALRSAGMIEVLRVTRLVRKASDMLSFTGVPTSSSSSVRGLEVSFVEGEAPAPGFDPVTGLLRLFYPQRERPEVERLLTSKRQRFCYFWRSRDGDQRHAWLLSSP